MRQFLVWWATTSGAALCAVYLLAILPHILPNIDVSIVMLVVPLFVLLKITAAVTADRHSVVFPGNTLSIIEVRSQ